MHHDTKHDTTAANTHARRRARRHDQAKAPQSPQRNSPRPVGRVCVRQQTQPLPATKQSPSGWTCVRLAGKPTPCRLQNSRRPDRCVCTRQTTQPLPATKQPPSGWMCVHPAVTPAPAGYETAALRMDVCAPGSEPSPCRLQNSRRLDGRVSTRLAHTACRLRPRATRRGDCPANANHSPNGTTPSDPHNNKPSLHHPDPGPAIPAQSSPPHIQPATDPNNPRRHHTAPSTQSTHQQPHQTTQTATRIAAANRPPRYPKQFTLRARQHVHPHPTTPTKHPMRQPPLPPPSTTAPTRSHRQPPNAGNSSTGPPSATKQTNHRHQHTRANQYT